MELEPAPIVAGVDGENNTDEFSRGSDNAEPSFMKQSFLIVLSAVVILLLLELGVRLSVRYHGSEVDRIRYLYSSSEIQRQRARLTGAPFLMYRLAPGAWAHNARGFRGPEVAAPKPPGVYRIVTLGGSTTYGEFIDRWEDAYPAQLERVLRGRQRPVEVINAGVPGYSSWEMLISLEFQILDLQPDLLIVYEAINDLYPRLVKPSRYDGLATSKGLWRTEARAIPASALYRFAALRLGWLEDPVAGQSQFDSSFSAEYCRLNATSTRCDNFDMTPETVLAANPPTYFERNVRSIIAIAHANDVQVMLSSWAHFPSAIPEVAHGTFMTLGFVRDTVAKHNSILHNVAAAAQVPFYDLAANLPVRRDFWIEGMHLSPAGAREQAALYADFLLQSKLIP